MVRIKTEVREQVMSQTRQTLLNAAAEEFASNGYDQANINAISTKAGFAKGTVYNYFPSKQALLMALIDSIAQEHLEYLRSAILFRRRPCHQIGTLLPGRVRVRYQPYPPGQSHVQHGL